MRCPKCGFHSFDYLDNCRKCGVDLTDMKLRRKFQGYVIPPAAESAPEPQAPFEDLPEVAETEEEAIDFGFDILEEESPPSLPSFAEDFVDGLGGQSDGAVEPEIDDPSAIDLARDSGLNFDQPFAAESENLPDGELPKLDDRF